MKNAKTLLALLLLTLAGCASNPFSQYYFDQSGGVDISTFPTVQLSTGEPKLYQGVNREMDNQSMLEQGFAMIGYSSFNAGAAKDSDAISHGRSIHADTIIVYSKYTDTVSGAMPLTLPDTQTSTTDIYGNMYGSGGFGSFSGTGTTTTYGSTTTYIPWSIPRHDYLATFWVKLKPPVFGAHIRELDGNERRSIQSNQGVAIIAVENGSPAFLADLMQGDILRRIGSIEVVNVNAFQEAIGIYQGQRVEVDFIRDGEYLSASVALGERR